MFFTFDVCLENKLQFTTCYYNRLIEEWRKKSDDNFVVGAVLTGLSKTFDCIPHDLSIAKRAAYGLSEEELVYILSYLSNRKQLELQLQCVSKYN